MMELADMVLPPLALHSLNLSGVLLATIGAIFLAYELLGRENGPLRWFTLIMTCGILSALIFVPVVTLDLLLLKPGQVKLTTILALILAGGFMGFYSVNLVELPPSTTKLPIFSWRGSLLGLPLALLFWFGGFFLMGPQFGIPILTLGIACAIITSTWQRLTWEPAQAGATPLGIGQVVAGEEPSASTPTPVDTGPFEAWKSAPPRPHVFSRKALLLGLLLGFLLWFVAFFMANNDAFTSLLGSVPLALISGVICGTWRFINWEPAHSTPHLFSRKGFWTGLVAGFVPWILYELAGSYVRVTPNLTGNVEGLEVVRTISISLCVTGLFALATAAAGSIAQYTLWRANQLPHRTLGAIGLVLIVVAFAFQSVQPVIDILNDIR